MSANASPEPARDAQPSSAAAAPTVEAPDGNVKELRLGLVCYGGVSLAIYMHGMTKEVHRAIRASVLQERGLPSDEGAASERAYRDLLEDLRSKQKVHTRIVVDAIAGSSAGGINGIFLAKALAHDLSQDALRDLWFEHGDLGKLIRKPKKRLGRLARWIAKALIRGDEDDVPNEAAKEALVGAALEIREHPLLDGNAMSNHIYRALAGMKPASPELESLMPARHPLDLTVTVTDHWGYPRSLPIADPPVIAEGQHRHLLKFAYRSDQRNDFSERENGALSLAARATSSLPVGFQPVHAGTFPNVLPPNATSWGDIEPFFRAYQLAHAHGEMAHLVDGGVLDNKPFAPVIRAIRQRHAANEVDRYLIFLEPDPTAAGEQKEQAPKPLEALIGALSGLPRSEPILDELAEVLGTNERVRAVRDAIEANWEPVAKRVRDTLGDLDEPVDPEDPRLADWNKRIHAEAARLGEFTYAGYLRLKISSAIDSFAGAASLLCDYTDASNQAFLVRELVRGWARRRGLFEHKESPTKAQQEFVQRFDLGFTQRRLHFVIAGVSWLYREADQPGHPTRKQLDTVKERLYEAVAKLEWLASGRAYVGEVTGLGERAAAVRSALETCFAQQQLDAYIADQDFDLDNALDDLSDDLDAVRDRLGEYLAEELDGFSGKLYLDLLDRARDWPVECRRILLIRYLGFPIWDSLLYPLQALSDVAERDEVRIARFSPADSKLLHPVHKEAKEAKKGKGGKVLGAGLGHAYAFFSLRARENDYLWGRLDAAERLVGLLLTSTETVDGEEEVVPGSKHPDYRKWCKHAFRAVLAEDTQRLPTIAGEVAQLKEQVEKLQEKAEEL